MDGMHLTPKDLETLVMDAIEEPARAAMTRHLADCAMCRARANRTEKLETGLHELPRAQAPHDLADRIVAAVDWRMTLAETRRRRLPFIAFATLASFVVSFWFAFQMVTAFIDDDALDFLSLYSSRPDLFSTYFSDAVFALIETLPLQEIALTAIAIVIAVVLAQQLVESVQPRVAH